MKKLSLSLLALTGLFNPVLVDAKVDTKHEVKVVKALKVILVRHSVRLIEELLIFDQSMRSLVVYLRSLRNDFLLGKITYKGVEITLKELAEIAQEMIAQNKKLDSEMMAIFDEMVAEFKVLSEPFLEIISEGKSVLVKVVEEWIEKRNVSDTNLQRWIDSEAGKEEELFSTFITSPVELHAFFYDLFVFLSDLVNSCPKAMADYQLTNKKLTKVQHVAVDIMKRRPRLSLQGKDFTLFLCWAKGSFVRETKFSFLTQEVIAKQLHTYVCKNK